MSDIKLEVNGIEYTGFTSAIASRTVQSMAGKFSFTTTVKANSNGIVQNDLKAQDEVKVYINDDLFLTGKIENLRIASDSSSHTISVSGRDKIGDLIDSSIIQGKFLQRNFQVLIKNILRQNGFSNIKVINNVGILTLETGEEVKTEKGETIAQFIDRYAEKLNVLVYSDKDGNLTINREGSDFAAGALLRQSNNPDSNILSSSIDIDITERYQYIQVYSQSDNESYGENSVDQNAIETDSEIIFPRRKIIPQNTASKAMSLASLAKWNVAIRRAKGARYQCQIQDFLTKRKGGALWDLNTIVSLKDEACQVEGQFLIEGVTFSKTNEGTFTDMAIVNRGSFSLNYDSNLNKSGDFAKNLIRTSSVFGFLS